MYSNREAKLDYAYELLASGLSGYAVNKACREKYKSGIGHKDILKLRRELEENLADGVGPSPITPLMLPPEMSELPPGPSLHGMTDSFRHIQDWMSEVQAEQIILTKDGKLSVLLRHQFDIGLDV
jgi:hypothetical protein